MRRKSPRKPIVTLDAVDVDIDGRRILRHIDFELMPGQHWGIVGRNGSGKSTLLALLAGIRWPAPGRGSRHYDFGAGPERDAVTARQRIALLGHELQDRYVARGWNFRARDIVLSGLTRSDIPKRRIAPGLVASAESLLEKLGLGPLAGRRLLGLSRGEQRRVLIARALATEPAVLLLDEPTSGLDAESGAALEVLLRLAAGSTQIVIAAHRREDLPAFITNCALLEAGRLRKSRTSRSARAKAAVVKTAFAADPAAKGAMELIVVANADVWLDGRRVLAGIDWTLRAGEHWLVTGPNGAGKSTLLRLLHGELRPARGGTIRWPGLGDPRNVWALRRKVSLVSPELQARYLHPTTVFDTVASGFHASIGKVRGLRAGERDRVNELIATFGLEPLAGRLLTSLSYGQRHRALIARTLVIEPRVLLLDEPWAGLDPETIGVVRHEIERRMAGGLSVVCVWHVGAGGLPFTRRLLLRGGRVVSGGGSGERPENSSSARRRGAGSRKR